MSSCDSISAMCRSYRSHTVHHNKQLIALSSCIAVNDRIIQNGQIVYVLSIIDLL